jgi:hypothetical protein
MWRSLIVAAIIYVYGHPLFDGFRPVALDRPLQGFYAEVNSVALAGRRALAGLGDRRHLGELNVYLDRIEARLKSSD